MKENNKVIINRIFNGSYNNNNIGHEFINIINPDDKGYRYLYICPEGYLGRDDYDDVKYIVFAQTIKKKFLKVIGISAEHEKMHKIYQKGEKTLSAIKEEYDRQCQDLKYLGIPVKEFFKLQDNTLLYTFKSSKFYVPKQGKIIYIANETDKQNDEKVKFIIYSDLKHSQYQYNYYDDINLCNQIKQLIEDDNMFELDKRSANDFLKQNNGTYKQMYKKSILDTIKKTDDENAFSNWFAEILEKEKTFCIKFVNMLIEKHNLNHKADVKCIDQSSKIYIQREHSTSIKNKEDIENNPNDTTENIRVNNLKRIDLWIETEDYIIFIENKIKSDINGYIEEKHNFEGKYKTQLASYYDYAKSYNDNEFNTKKTIIPIILSPNYSEINQISNYLENIDCSEFYTKVTYRDILDLCNDYKGKKSINFESIYFDEFINAIDRHTKDLPLSVYETIYQKVIDFAKIHN